MVLKLGEDSTSTLERLHLHLQWGDLQLMEFNFNENNFDNDFVKWESEIQKFEKETTSALADAVKIAILMNKTKGDIQRHVRLNASKLARFSEARDTSLSYVKAMETLMPIVPTSTSSPSGPMEIWRFQLA